MIAYTQRVTVSLLVYIDPLNILLIIPDGPEALLIFMVPVAATVSSSSFFNFNLITLFYIGIVQQLKLIKPLINQSSQ